MVDKARQRLRAEKHIAALDEWWAKGNHTLNRRGLTLVFDAPPAFQYDREGNAIGVDAWVRAFRAGSEVKIDPHRRFMNPPLRHAGEDNPFAAYEEILFDQVERSPNPRGWRTSGTVSTFFASTTDGRISSVDTVYLTARAGGAGADSFSANTTGDIFVGQAHDSIGGGYQCYEGFISFDTSSLDDSATISAATLQMWCTDDNSTTNFNMRTAIHDWGATLTTADWVAGASLGALTDIDFVGSAGFTVGAYNTIAADSADIRNSISKTGTTYYILFSDRHRDGNTPSNDTDEYAEWSSADETGTTQDPKLTVTTADFVSVSAAVATATSAAIPASAIQLTQTVTASIATATATVIPAVFFKNASITAAIASATAAALAAFGKHTKIHVPRTGASRVLRSAFGASRAPGTRELVETAWDDGIGWDEGLWDYNLRVTSSRQSGTAR